MRCWAGSGAAPALGLALLALAVLGRASLEARLVTHVLVLFPLLLAGGALLADARQPEGLRDWNRGGTTGLALAFAILAFWMVPRAIDTSLVDGRYELAKLASLPIAGAALAGSLPVLPWLVRQLLAAQAIAMAAAIGWLYTAVPERLCLRYPRSEQDELGSALLLLAFAAFALWLARLLLAEAVPPRERGSSSALAAGGNA